MENEVVTWDLDRLDDLCALVERCLPDEGLSGDELRACCWDEPGLVLGTPDGTGVMVADRSGEVAAIKLLLVHPGNRGRGVGRALLDAALEWAWAGGATEIRLGGSSPFFLWPGVDVLFTSLVALARSAGFHSTGWTGLRLPTAFRAVVPEGITVERALDEPVVAAVRDLADRLEGPWSVPVHRAIEQGTCLVAVSGGEVVGFACHSVNRTGWIGPLVVEPAVQRQGIGAALLSEICRDLMIVGLVKAELSPPDLSADALEQLWPTGFFAQAGAEWGHSYQLLHLDRP